MKPVTNSETYLKPLRLRKYLQYTRAEFMRGLRYRANYWATLCSSVIMTVIQWSLWRAVYINTTSIAGVSLPAMMAYVLIGRVISGFRRACKPQYWPEGQERGHSPRPCETGRPAPPAYVPDLGRRFVPFGFHRVAYIPGAAYHRGSPDA